MREIFDMNFGWKYQFGDIEKRNKNCIHDLYNRPEWLKAGNNGVAFVSYDDSSWEDVDLPHDFVIERSEFSPLEMSSAGYLVKGISWYRKTFFIEKEDVEKRLFIEFDGVFRDCDVWLNGHYLGSNRSGYMGFDFEITEVTLYGKANSIAVRVDASEYEGWWYEGGGIYRDVRLVKTSKIRLSQYSPTIIANNIDCENKSAVIGMNVSFLNIYDSFVAVKLKINIIHPNGDIIYSENNNYELLAFKELDICKEIHLNDCVIWDIQNTNLYTAELILTTQYGVDEVKSKFGIRKIAFNSQNGFELNNNPIKLKGVCGHDDFAGVGVAINPSIIEYRMNVLKEMGCNAYRCSHNPPSTHLLDICDKLGILVIDETRLPGTSDQCINDFKKLIYRDCNHPCIIAWSLGNEEMNIQGTSVGVSIFNKMINIGKQIDDSRPYIIAMNCGWDEIIEFHEENGSNLDLNSVNYFCLRDFDIDERVHSRYPNMCLLSSESGATLSARGYIVNETSADNLSDNGRKCIWEDKELYGKLSCYSNMYPSWGLTPVESWKSHISKPYMAGLFLWTGFDYRGETYPYIWPNVVSCYGITDLCAFPKDVYYYWKSQWTNGNILHIFPHWNNPVKQGEKLKLVAYTSVDAVELFINEVSQGKKCVELNGYLSWDVIYEPGIVNAVGYKQEVEIIRTQIQTVGKPFALKADVVNNPVFANGQDTAFIRISVIDINGQEVPDADNLVSITVKGEGTLLGTGNGSPISHEHDKKPFRKLYAGKCLVLVKSTLTSGKISVNLFSEGIQGCDVEITSKSIKNAVLSTIKNSNSDENKTIKVPFDGGI